MTATPPTPAPDPATAPATATDPGAAAPTDPTAAPVDQAFLDLVAKLGPVFTAVAQAAVKEAIGAVPVPLLKPGVVLGVTASTRTALVLVDGDATGITVQVIVDLPGIGDRVMVEFVPPSAVFMVGFVTDVGVPAGSLQAYTGTVNLDTGAPSTSATPGMPPRGWLWCHGQAVNRSTYGALFNAIGTTYGAGDGATTFNVPDLRGRIPLGLDNMGGTDAGRLSVANTLGGSGGAESLTIASGNLPSHTHDMQNHTHDGSGLSVASHNHSISSDGNHDHTQPDSVDITATQGAASGGDFGAARDFNASANTGFNGSHDHGGSSGAASPGVSGTTGTPSNNTTTATGSGTALTSLPPYLLVHWLIKS